MKKSLLYIIILCSWLSCKNEIDYDISGAEIVPAVNAFWSTEEEEHLVYLSGSEAYTVSVMDEAEVSCIINDGPAVFADTLWAVSSNGNYVAQCYRVRAKVGAGDNVTLIVSLPSRQLLSSVKVPDPVTISVDSITVATESSNTPFREYGLSLKVTDIHNTPSYYRIYDPAILVEGWDQWSHSLVARREWPSGLQLDDNDPIFKRPTVPLPEDRFVGGTFIHSGMSNTTHIFTDDSFSDSSHMFNFTMDQRQFSVFRYENYNLNNSPDFNPETDINSYDWLKYMVRFYVSSISDEEYRYMLAYNSARSSYTDPFSEPVIIPSNIEGGIGFFAIENTSVCELQLEDCLFKNTFIALE